MKSAIKSWFATNLFEISSLMGLIIIIRELLSVDASTLMLAVGLVGVLISDTKLNAYIQAKSPGIKKWIESL